MWKQLLTVVLRDACFLNISHNSRVMSQDLEQQILCYVIPTLNVYTSIVKDKSFLMKKYLQAIKASINVFRTSKPVKHLR